MVDYTVSKSGSGSNPWVIKQEGERIVQRFSTKKQAVDFARRNYTGQQVIVFYANKPGIDESFIPGGAQKSGSDFHRGRQL